MKVGTGLSTQRDILSCVRDATEQARGKIGRSKIDLAILFSSTDFALPSLLKTATEKIGDVSLIGCSGVAVMSNHGIHRHALAVALINSEGQLDINTAYVKDVTPKLPFTAGKQLADALVHESKGRHRDLGIFFADGIINESYKLILGLQEKFGTIYPIMGACASDNLRFRKTYVYYDRLLLSDAASGILWGGKFHFGLGLRHGFSPIGRHRIITRGHGHIIETIDNKPAVSLYEEFFAMGFSVLKKEIKSISRTYPLGVYLSNEKEYLIRNVLAVEEDGALVCQGDIINGSIVRMMIGTKERFIEAAGQAIEDAKQDLTVAEFGTYEQAPSIDMTLVFSSAYRYTFLGKNVAGELETIQKSVGAETPIIGVYTYGEFAPFKGISSKRQSYFHNHSIATLIMGS